MYVLVTTSSGLSFGVYKALDKRTNKPVAIKMMRLTAKNFRYILPEILNHKSLRHPNVVDFIDAFFIPDERQLWVVLEYMDAGNLTQMLDPPSTGVDDFLGFSGTREREKAADDTLRKKDGIHIS